MRIDEYEKWESLPFDEDFIESDTPDLDVHKSLRKKDHVAPFEVEFLHLCEQDRKLKEQKKPMNSTDWILMMDGRDMSDPYGKKALEEEGRQAEEKRKLKAKPFQDDFNPDAFNKAFAELKEAPSIQQLERGKQVRGQK